MAILEVSSFTLDKALLKARELVKRLERDAPTSDPQSPLWDLLKEAQDLLDVIRELL